MTTMTQGGTQAKQRTGKSRVVPLFLWMVVTTAPSCHVSATDAISCISTEGDASVGIGAYADPTCSYEQGVGTGCFNNAACRYCQSFQTAQSAHLSPCPTNSNNYSNSNNSNNLNTLLPTFIPAAAPSSAPIADAVPISEVGAPTSSPTTRSTTVTEPPSQQGTETEGGGGQQQPQPEQGTRETLFFDDFSQGFDLSQYKHEITMSGGGNWEFQMYINNRTNSYVQGGILHIKPTLTTDWIPNLDSPINLYGMTRESDCTSAKDYGCERTHANPISSARIQTRSFAFRTGRLEVRAKLPRGDWLWPALWLLPEFEMYGSWPVSGEIDIMESTGNAPGYGPGGDRGVDFISSTLHWGLSFWENKYNMTHAKYSLDSGTDFSQDFHTFGLVRTETGLYTYVDDDANRVLEVDWSSQSFFERGGWDPAVWNNPWEAGGVGAPFDQQFYLIINVAVGGLSFFPDGYGNKPWTNDSPTAAEDFWNARDIWYPSWQPNHPTFQIDWINVTSF